MKNKHINQLDVFRGLAALSVCAVHFTYDSFFHKYFARGLFVQLFFTLSGFVIAYNYHNNLNSFKNFLQFTIKRFKRLYPLHLFFLLLFLFIEIIKYFSKIQFEVNFSNQPFEINNFKNFFLNLFFLQHYAGVNNFNSPSWSISVEMILYLYFGLILLVFTRKTLLTYLYFFYIVFFILFLNKSYGSSFSNSAFFSGLYSFSIGYIFFLLFEKKTVNNFFTGKLYIDIIFYIFITIFLFEIFYFNLIKEIYIYSLIFGLLIFFSCFLNKNFFLFKVFFNNFFIFLGKISYSIYMSHLLIFFLFDNTLKYIIKFETKINLYGNNVLDLNSYEANLFSILIYILTVIFSNFTYKNIEMRFYKK